MPFLYVVATPIGNLEDVTLRALRVLGEVEVIAAEDTRVTRKLLAHYKIRTKVVSYHEHNKISKMPSILNVLRDKNVALVCDAGMPTINDPGAELVSEAVNNGVKVVSVPGPSALTSAIAVSGLSVGSFVFVGFFPRKRADRKKLLTRFDRDERVIVAFETPHRVQYALADVLDVLGDRPIAVCRELTKLHEEVFSGTVSEALSHFTTPKGELTLVIGGGENLREDYLKKEKTARVLLARLKEDGSWAKESVKLVAQETGLSRGEVYRIWLDA